MNPKPLGLLALIAFTTVAICGPFEESKTYSWGPDDFKAQVVATIKGDAVSSLDEFNNTNKVLKSIEGSVAASAHIFGKNIAVAKIGYQWRDGSGEWTSELAGNIVDFAEIGDFTQTPVEPPDLNYTHTFYEGSMVFWAAGIPITLSFGVGGNWGVDQAFKPKFDGSLTGLSAEVSGNAGIVANASAAVSLILVRGGVGLDVTLFDTKLTSHGDVDWKHTERLFLDLDMTMRPWSVDLHLFYQFRVISWSCWGCRWGTKRKWTVWSDGGTLSRWSLYQDWSYLLNDPESESLVIGTPKSVSTDVANNGQLFAIDLPTGPVKATITAQGGSGDVNLYLSQGSHPDPDQGDHQFKSQVTGNNESVTFIGNLTQANRRLYTLAHANQAFENTQLLTTISTARNPTARIASSANYNQISFHGRDSSQGEGPIASYSWDFGDGHTGNGIAVNHTYTSDGSYTVRLTVTDIYGISSSTQTVVGVAQLSIQGPSSIQANTNHDWSVVGNSIGPGPYTYAWSYRTDCGSSALPISQGANKGPSCNRWHPTNVNAASITLGRYFSHRTQLKVQVTNGYGQTFLANKTVYVTSSIHE